MNRRAGSRMDIRLSASVFVVLLALFLALLPLGYAVVAALLEPIPPSVPPVSWRRVLRLSASSLNIASGTALVATLLGVCTALALDVIRVPGRRAFWTVTAIPAIVPPYVWAVAWIELDGIANFTPSIFSPGGAIVVSTLGLYPVVAAAMAIGLRSLDAHLVEAATLNSSPTRTLARVVLPLVSPSIATGALIVFLFALTGFAVPSLLRVEVLPVEVFARYSAFHDIRGGMLASLPLILLAAAALLAWYFAVWHGRELFRGASSSPVSIAANRSLRYAATAWCLGLTFIAVIAPLVRLAWSSLPLSSYAEAWSTAREELWTSASAGAVSALCIVFVGFTAACAIRTRPVCIGLLLAMLLPFVASAPALGIGMIQFWNHDGLRGWIYDGPGIIVIAWTARFLFVGMLAAIAVRASLDPALEEAASVSGAGWLRRQLLIVAPACAPALAGAWALCFLLAFGEADVSVLVAPPGATPLGVRVFGLMHYGPSSLVAALCILTAGLAIVAGGAAFWVLSRGRARPVGGRGRA